MRITVSSPRPIVGDLAPPGDKSVAHRVLLFAALASGESKVRRWLDAGVTRSMVSALGPLGVVATVDGDVLTVRSPGIEGMTSPAAPLFCGNSGTTLRFLTGLASRSSFRVVLDGAEGLRRRPMERVAVPLRQLGADVVTTDGRAPVMVTGGRLRGVDVTLDKPSAQVQTALVIAALGAEGATVVRHAPALRDHTVRLAAGLGLPVTATPEGTRIEPGAVSPFDVTLPGDPSAAAFLVVAAALTRGNLRVKDVGVNPTRTGLFEVLRRMGVSLVEAARSERYGEPLADLAVSAGDLRGVTVSGADVVRMIDEFPVFTLAALAARGRTIVRDAAELRYKESDRIEAVAKELGKLGACIAPKPDGFEIEGPQRLRGGQVDARGDHRLAMTLCLAAALADGPITLDGAEFVAESYPRFFDELRRFGWTVEASS